jgi:hypothetical protein
MMQSLFSNALAEAGSKHIKLSPPRRETLGWLALLIMRAGTIWQCWLAAHGTTAARTESARRRFYRFFQLGNLDGAMAAQPERKRLTCRSEDEIYREALADRRAEVLSAPDADLLRMLQRVSARHCF